MTEQMLTEINAELVRIGAPVEARETKHKGIGLFATCDVKKGDHIFKERALVSFSDFHLHDLLVNNPPEDMEND